MLCPWTSSNNYIFLVDYFTYAPKFFPFVLFNVFHIKYDSAIYIALQLF